MLCCAIGALRSENDTAGFELPIPCGGQTTDCYSVEHQRRQKYETATLRHLVFSPFRPKCCETENTDLYLACYRARHVA
jgi:hypothetical protein